jgi:hypothetical protein
MDIFHARRMAAPAWLAPSIGDKTTRGGVAVHGWNFSPSMGPKAERFRPQGYSDGIAADPEIRAHLSAQQGSAEGQSGKKASGDERKASN